MGNFDISTLPIDLLLNFLNIFLLFIIVKALVYKPVRKFLDARTAKIESEITAARNEKEAAEKVKSDYDNLVAQSETSAREIIKSGEDKAVEKSAIILENAKKQADVIICDAQKKIDEDRAEAMEDMKKEVVKLALEISEKVLAREITDKDTREIAEDYFGNPNKGKAV